MPAGWVPVGTVAYVQSFLGYTVRPDYAPEWLQALVHRRIWISHTPPSHPCFIKPADGYKRFDGHFHREGGCPPDGPLFCSDPLPLGIAHEWRYYLADGRVIASGWYDGSDQSMTPPAPAFPVTIPYGYCGAIDIAELTDGRLALIEAHHPFACGWYGPLHEAHLYVRWLVCGWLSLIKNPRSQLGQRGHL
jgi:hypothetical protein